tara:strand:+ start:2047 stop:2523 length:477 start_codon:yes stop_codon:yes gene_type:complete
MKKQLLNESEIRKLMKFANIGSLTSGFVEKLDESFHVNEQDDEVPPGDENFETEEPPDVAPPESEVDAMPEVDDSVLEGVKTCIQALKTGLESMGLQEAADAITLEMTDGEPDDEEAMPTEMPDIDVVPDEEEPAEDPDLMQEVLTRVVKRLRRSTRR